MNGEKFFGKSESVNPEDTLEEVVDQMEKIDKENQKRGGDGTVVLKHNPEKSRVNLSTEEVPEPRNNEQEDN